MVFQSDERKIMENTKHKLDTDAVGRLLLSFGVPTFLAMLVQTLYNMVDIIFVGRFVGTEAIAGLTIVLPIQLFTVGIGLMTGIGGSSLISRKLGSGDVKSAERALGNALLLTLIVAAIITITGLANVKFWCRVLGATDSILPYSADFLGIILAGMAFSTVSFAFSHLIRAGGNPTTPMVGQVLGSLLNILLDAIFVIRLGLGVKGAALATVISQAISVFFYIGYYILCNPAVRLHIKSLMPDPASVKSILTIGVSSIIMMLTNSLCSVFVNRAIVTYGGDMAVSAYGIINQVLMFAILPAIVIGQGLQPIIGYNFGAGRYDRVIRGIITGLTATVVMGILVFTAVMLIPESIAGLFTENRELISLSSHAIKRVFAVMYLSGITIIGSSIFQSLGKALPAFVASISRSALFLLPLILILPRFIQLGGVWLAFPFNDFLAAALTAGLTIPVIRKIRKAYKTEIL